MKRTTYAPVAMAVLLASCSSMDMQGVDPNLYYSQHPVKNTVETRHAVHIAQFAGGYDKLSSPEIEALQMALHGISPDAVESIKVSVSRSQLANPTRREHLEKLLRGMGYPSKLVTFDSRADLKQKQAEIDVAYASVVPPHCPDWRTSPTNTYSNTTQANFGCATTVNLGQMVADPRDLERGTGDVSPETERATGALRSYRQGISFGTSNTVSTTSISPNSDTSDSGSSGGGAQ